MKNFSIEIYADGADRKQIEQFANDPMVSGVTTNPSLMRAAGIKDYETFASDLLSVVPEKPVSFEVFSDELDEMILQAKKIASWGKNVFVKIPITNSEGISTAPVVYELSKAGIKLNITAIFTVAQTAQILKSVAKETPTIISVFAGRIADTGVSPEGIIHHCKELVLLSKTKSKLLWASTREVLNVFQAEASGADIITMTPDLIKKLALVGKNLDSYSLETVKMFKQDGESVHCSI